MELSGDDGLLGGGDSLEPERAQCDLVDEFFLGGALRVVGLAPGVGLGLDLVGVFIGK